MAAISIFSKDIRILDGLFSLNDLHKSSGSIAKHKPSNFIRLSQTIELINEIDQFSDLRTAYKVVNGGDNRGTYVCKELVYAYAMWISAKFHLAVIRAFDQLSNTPQGTIGEDGFNCLSSLIEGKTTKLPSKCRRSAQSKLWSQVHKAFGVRSGHDIPADQLSDVRNFIAAYAIEGEYLPSKGQSELGLAEPFMGLDHLKLSGNRNIPDGRKLLKEMGKYMPAKAQPLLVELEATMVRQWTEMDESLRMIGCAQRYMSRCRGQISELPDQI